jgi:cation diffusion facilitator family transporter
MESPGVRDGIRAAQLGLLVSAALAATKLVAGILGNSYALIADGVESVADVASSLIVWGGLSIAALPPDEDHPFGHGRAESLAAAVVALTVLGAALGIAIKAVSEIRVPHHVPAPWTLIVLIAVVAIKWWLSRRVAMVGTHIGSAAVRADALHHLGDAMTSAAAFAGILIAVVAFRMTGDLRWAQADDWAALLATVVIARNGVMILLGASNDLMDRMPGPEILTPIRDAALSIHDVRAIEKLQVRKSGLRFRVTLHVQADSAMSLHDSHIVGGKVKGAIRAAIPAVESVLVHMEPFEERAAVAPAVERRV